jgi:hypothetical protein
MTASERSGDPEGGPASRYTDKNKNIIAGCGDGLAWLFADNR